MATKTERKKIRQEIVRSEFQFCESPREFYIAMGQMVKYGFTRDDLITSVRKDMFITPQARKEKSLYIDLFCDLGRCRFTDNNGQKLISAPEEEILRYVEMMRDAPTYRIKIYEDSSVETTCYDLLDNFKPELDNHYEHLDDLPEWVQNKLAVLMLLDHKVNNEEVKDVGRRISEDIYWVFKRENDGEANTTTS